MPESVTYKSFASTPLASFTVFVSTLVVSLLAVRVVMRLIPIIVEPVLRIPVVETVCGGSKRGRMTISPNWHVAAVIASLVGKTAAMGTHLCIVIVYFVLLTWHC